MAAQILKIFGNGSVGAKTVYPRMCAHTHVFFKLIQFLLPHSQKLKRQGKEETYPRQDMGVFGNDAENAPQTARLILSEPAPAAAQRIPLAAGPFTLDDLRRSRAEYEAAMAALDESRWTPRREYFRTLRRFPVDGNGNLSAATAPRIFSNQGAKGACDDPE